MTVTGAAGCRAFVHRRIRRSTLQGPVLTPTTRPAGEGLLPEASDTLNPEIHPALRLIGLVPGEGGAPEPSDAARDHDRVLAEGEEAAWAASARHKPPRRGS